MNQAAEFGDEKRDFSFLACSGKTATQVKDEQVPKLKDRTQQIITLTVGGNDVLMTEVLDACVYQWSTQAALTDKCPEALQKSKDAFDNDLLGWLDDLYTALKKKLVDDGQIYVTGYARVWDSKSDLCSDIAWYVGH
jgi:lysophospholipase L1-like esterase